MNAVATSHSAFQKYVPTRVGGGKNREMLAFTGRASGGSIWSNAWRNGIEEKFSELMGLPFGWDGYQGRPVSQACADFAKSLLSEIWPDSLPPPSIVPGSDGTLQIEWHMHGYDIEIDVLGTFKLAAYRLDHKNGQEEVVELGHDFTPLKKWMTDLATVDRRP